MNIERVDMDRIRQGLLLLASAFAPSLPAEPAAEPAAEPEKPKAARAKKEPPPPVLKTTAEAETALRALARDFSQAEGINLLSDLGVKTLKELRTKAETQPDIFSVLVQRIEERRAELTAGKDETGGDGDPFGV